MRQINFDRASVSQATSPDARRDRVAASLDSQTSPKNANV